MCQQLLIFQQEYLLYSQTRQVNFEASVSISNIFENKNVFSSHGHKKAYRFCVAAVKTKGFLFGLRYCFWNSPAYSSRQWEKSRDQKHLFDTYPNQPGRFSPYNWEIKVYSLVFFLVWLAETLLLGEGVLKCTANLEEKTDAEVRFQINFIEITLQHRCYPVTLLRISRTPFPKNIFGLLPLNYTQQMKHKARNKLCFVDFFLSNLGSCLQ